MKNRFKEKFNGELEVFEKDNKFGIAYSIPNIIIGNASECGGFDNIKSAIKYELEALKEERERTIEENDKEYLSLIKDLIVFFKNEIE